MAAVSGNNPSSPYGIFAPWKEGSRRFELFKITWNRSPHPTEPHFSKQAKAIGHLAAALLLTIPVINYLALVILGRLSPTALVAPVDLIGIYWGEEFGLDIEAGLSDDNREFCGAPQITEERLINFRAACRNKGNMIEETVRRINERLDEHGCVMNISAYQAETRDILRNKGFTETEIDDKIDPLFPTDDVTYRVSITKEAAIMLLTRTGHLNP